MLLKIVDQVDSIKELLTNSAPRNLLASDNNLVISSKKLLFCCGVYKNYIGKFDHYRYPHDTYKISFYCLIILLAKQAASTTDTDDEKLSQ